MRSATVRGRAGFAITVLTAVLAAAGCTGEVALTAATITAAAIDEGGHVPLQPGELAGEIEVRIVDFEDGRSERRYHLLTGEGLPPRLLFSSDPELAPGTRLVVTGSAAGRALTVDRFRVVGLDKRSGAGLEADQPALIGAPAFPKRRMAFVLLDLGMGVNITVDEARRKAFGMAPGDQSMKQVMLEYSFGRQDLEGEVLGPFHATMQGCDEDAVAASLRPMIPAGFDNIVWYFGNRVSACGWAGVAPLGRVGRIAGQLWVNGTASCRVATHEFGHNLGLQHAARLRCMGAAFADDPSKCMSSEYGDSADVMGDGCNHINAYSKAYLTYLDKCNGVQVGGSGSFTIAPLESSCNGPQVLIVPMPKMRRVGGTDVRNYVLELRAPIGLDTRFVPQVLVRVAAPLVGMRSARMTWILDTNPATTPLDGLKQGETFMDPAGGLSFTVEAVSASSATIKVDGPAGGASTCLDNTPFAAAPGPETCVNNAPAAPPAADAGSAPPRDAGSPFRDAGSGPSSRGGAAGGSGPTGSGGQGGGGGKGSGGVGQGGVGRGGAGGAAGPTSAADAGAGQKPVEASNGCSCRMGSTSAADAGGAFGFLGAGLLAALLARRRLPGVGGRGRRRRIRA